jgi:hypothetical protein
MKSKKCAYFSFGIEIFTLIFTSVIFIYDIITVFAKSTSIVNAGYTEVKRSTWFYRNTTRDSYKFYVVKNGFTIDNCSESDYIDDGVEIYNFIVNRFTLAFFLVSEFGKLALIILTIYLAFRKLRQGDPNGKGEKKKKNCWDKFCACCSCCCRCLGISLWMLYNKVVIATTFSIPTYLLDAFDYSTPCLQLKYSILLTDLSPIIPIHFLNILIYMVFSVIAVWLRNRSSSKKASENKNEPIEMRQISEYTSNESSDQSYGSGSRTSGLIFVYLVFCLILGVATFFQMLITKHGPKIQVAANSATIILGILQNIRGCCCCS